MRAVILILPLTFFIVGVFLENNLEKNDDFAPILNAYTAFIQDGFDSQDKVVMSG